MQGEVSDLLRLRNRLPLSKTRWPSVHCSQCCRNPREWRGQRVRSKLCLPSVLQHPDALSATLNLSDLRVNPELWPCRAKVTDCMSGTQGQGDMGASLAALLQGADTTDGKREEEWKEKTPGERWRNKYIIQVPPGSGANCLRKWLKEKRGLGVQPRRQRHVLPSLVPGLAHVWWWGGDDMGRHRQTHRVPSSCSLTNTCAHMHVYTHTFKNTTSHS